LAEKGKKVMLIGCDPKRDATLTLVGRRLTPLLEMILEGNVSKESIIHKGYRGVLCIEIGGPEPGIGCAGRGLILAFKELEEIEVFNGLDLVIYDVPGDIVCGGFAVPMREGNAREVYIVTSGEYLSLFAANNICRAIRRVGAKLGGVICNSRNVENEEEIVKSFAERIGGGLIGIIPRDKIVQHCESKNKTVVECAPESKQAKIYRNIAETIFKNRNLVKPNVLGLDELNAICFSLLSTF
jgi:nitrogenase iron protein NifH